MLLYGIGLRTNKTKLMVVENCGQADNIVIDRKNIGIVADFCYAGSVGLISSNSSCDNEIKTRLGKASSVVARLYKIWSNKGLSMQTKVRLYEALVISSCCMVQTHDQ